MNYWMISHKKVLKSALKHVFYHAPLPFLWDYPSKTCCSILLLQIRIVGLAHWLVLLLGRAMQRRILKLLMQPIFVLYSVSNVHFLILVNTCFWILNCVYYCWFLFAFELIFVGLSVPGSPILASINVLRKGIYVHRSSAFLVMDACLVLLFHELKWKNITLYFSVRYKEGELHIGENSCIDRCVLKYWQVID